MNREEQFALNKALTPKLTKYIPHIPTVKQRAGLLLDDTREVFYGGAAGGGKSDWLLMAALQYVDIPGYNAILFRKTYQDLALPDALMSRAKEWLFPYRDKNGGVHWNEKDKVFTFPSGATLSFGYLEHLNDRFRYQGAAYQFLGFDELTQIAELCYTYLFSRRRRAAGSTIPLRFRAASNPGGEGHVWVKERFLGEEAERKGRVFIPAMLDDNPFLDQEEYRISLYELDPVTRAQLLEGNWEILHGGEVFDPEWFDIVESVPEGIRTVRFWDLASTKKEKGKKPCYTAGLKLGIYKGKYYIMHVTRLQDTPGVVEARMKAVMKGDGRLTTIGIEQEPGSSGDYTIAHFKKALKPYKVKGLRSTGKKEERARPVSIEAQAGNIAVVKGNWNQALFDELTVFPDSTYKDQADALSGAFLITKSQVNFYTVPQEVDSRDSYWHGMDSYEEVGAM